MLPSSLSPSLRILKNLTRPKSAIEYAVYKRFKAACTAVGAGRVGDAAYADAIRSEFNELESDGEDGQPQHRRRSLRPPLHGPRHGSHGSRVRRHHAGCRGPRRGFSTSATRSSGSS